MKTKLKPFHESIVDAISDCKTRGQLITLAKLVKVTIIPKNHEKIFDVLEFAGKAFQWNDIGVEEKLIEEAVVIRPKSASKKDECICCEKPATVEAVYKKATIRCCESESCQFQAKKLAWASRKL